MRLSCAIEARTLPQLALWKNAFLMTRLGMSLPQTSRTRSASSRLSCRWTRRNWSLIPSGLDTVDIEAGSFGSPAEVSPEKR